MIKLSDCEFLMWVARRLLYRYKDDPKVVGRLESIARELATEINKFEYITKNDFSDVEKILG
jgi:hypothetical protein